MVRNRDVAEIAPFDIGESRPRQGVDDVGDWAQRETVRGERQASHRVGIADPQHRATTGAHHAREFRAGGVEIGHEIHGVDRDRCVERVVVERQRGQRTVEERDPVVGESNNTLTYLIAWASMAEREAKWTAFQNDSDWLKAKSDSEADGAIVATVVNSFLAPTAFSAVR